MTEKEIHELNGKPVVVVTHGGMPVSLGKIRVSHVMYGAAAPRVELVFETETLACSLGVPLARVAMLRASWDGEQYKHRLPEGDRVWLPSAEPQQLPLADPVGELVQTFPLPPASRLIGPKLDAPAENPPS